MPSSPLRWSGIGFMTICRPLTSAMFPTSWSRLKGSGTGMEAIKRSLSRLA